VVREDRVDPEYDVTYTEAADWFARLHEAQISVEEIMEWQRLMASDRRFAIAYSRVEEVWNAIGDIPTPNVAQVKAEMRDRYDGTVPISQWVRAQRAWKRPGRLPALLAASVASIALATYWLFWDTTGAVRVLQTPAGHNLAFALADGSRLNLGADTRLEIRFNATSRRIRITRGEAFFAVAKDRNRPFIVRAGNATVTAVGTEFSVNRGADQVVIAVIEGRVVVDAGTEASPDSRPDSAKTQLGAGQQILVSAAGAGSSASLSNVTLALGWQNGRLAFQSEPLSRVLVDVNRYASKPISVDGSTIGDLMLTGTVVRDDVSGWLASLEKAFPVRVVEDSQRITIRPR